jgi:hypothetical protein
VEVAEVVTRDVPKHELVTSVRLYRAPWRRLSDQELRIMEQPAVARQ